MTARKAAATRKTPVSKSIASTATKAAKAKATETATALPMIRAFTVLGHKAGPYTGLTSNRKAFSAWTLASLCTAGYATISDKGTATKAKAKAQPKLLRALIGSTAWNHWGKARIDHKAAELTVAGLNEIAARLSDQSRGYNTDLDIVRAFMDAQAKGGAVEVGKDKFAVDSEIAVVKV